MLKSSNPGTVFGLPGFLLPNFVPVNGNAAVGYIVVFMFHHLSWQQFLHVSLILLAAWYVAIYFLFYHRRMKTYWRDKASGLQGERFHGYWFWD